MFLWLKIWQWRVQMCSWSLLKAIQAGFCEFWWTLHQDFFKKWDYHLTFNYHTVTCVMEPTLLVPRLHSPTETSWAKAREMRRRGRPTATQVTILSTASSVRTLRYRAWFGSFSRKSLNTYSVATCAMAMSMLCSYLLTQINKHLR